MRGWSFPIGSIFGVELRLHLLFLVLLAFAIPYATFTGVNGGRGIALWLLILLAVAVREIARALAAAWLALDLRSILLLPTGGLHTYGSSEAANGAQTRRNERLLGVVGPLANLCFGLVLGGLILTFAPAANLKELRWITPAALLRSLVWANLMLAGLHCIPAFPLDAGRLLRTELDRRDLGPASRAAQMAATVGPSFAVGMTLGGLASVSLWMMMVGASLYLSHRLEQQSLSLNAGSGLPGALPPEGQAAVVTMRDVMLTDYTMLSASSTLEDAMHHAGHTLQDVYPVVRGGNLVGAVSRQNIVESLESNGNGYIQGVMTRGFQTASPTDSLVPTLRRIMSALANQRAQLVPILDGERVVGIITPQNLQRSMTMLHQTRRMKQATRRDED